jgi:hypothetical protein
VGINLGSKLSLITEPFFSAHSVKYGTQNSTNEFIKNTSLSTAVKPVYDYIPGKRFWEIQMSSVTIPVYLRFKLLGNDKIGLYVQGGFSWRKFITSSDNTKSYKTNFLPDQTNGVDYQETSGNPIAEVYIDGAGDGFYAFDDSYRPDVPNFLAIVGHFRYSSQFPNGASESLTFGGSDTDQMTGTNWNLILGTALKYNVDDEGKFAITLDLNWNRGLSNMYSKTRITRLSRSSTFPYKANDLDPQFALSKQWDYIPENVTLGGNQTMNTTLFSIGFEFCPSCGGW